MYALDWLYDYPDPDNYQSLAKWVQVLHPSIQDKQMLLVDSHILDSCQYLILCALDTGYIWCTVDMYVYMYMYMFITVCIVQSSELIGLLLCMLAIA